MANYNRIILVGNCTRDPQLKQIAGGTSVAEWGLAVNHKYKTSAGEQREDVLFIDCVIFGKGAEIIHQYVKKGKPLMIDGRLRYETWEDKQGGGKRSKHSVTVENFQFLGDGQGGAGGGDRQQDRAPQRQAAPQRAPGQRPQTPQQEPPFGEEQIFNEPDIPFAWAGRSSSPL